MADPKATACLTAVTPKEVVSYFFEYDPTEIEKSFPIEYNDIRSQGWVAPTGCFKFVGDQDVNLTITLDARERMLKSKKDMSPMGVYQDVVILEHMGIPIGKGKNTPARTAPPLLYLVFNEYMFWKITIRKVGTKFSQLSAGMVPLKAEVSLSFRIESDGYELDLVHRTALYQIAAPPDSDYGLPQGAIIDVPTWRKS